MIVIKDVSAVDIDGLPVRRVLPQAGARAIGPLVFLDHLGPVEFAAGDGLDVRPHPHVGLSTVTYLLEGTLTHRDSLGSVQDIRPGEVNWMRAGTGIVHSERSPTTLRQQVHRLHALQCWVAATAATEDAAPAFRHVPLDEVPRVLAPGIDLRLIAGAGFERAHAVPDESPCAAAVLKLARQMRFEFRPEFPERAVYVVAGEVLVGGERCLPHQLAVLGSAKTLFVDALAPSVLVLLAGAPVGERHVWWNFVASTRDRIETARARWAASDFDTVPDDAERIPLPT